MTCGQTGTAIAAGGVICPRESVRTKSAIPSIRSRRPSFRSRNYVDLRSGTRYRREFLGSTVACCWSATLPNHPASACSTDVPVVAAIRYDPPPRKVGPKEVRKCLDALFFGTLIALRVFRFGRTPKSR